MPIQYDGTDAKEGMKIRHYIVSLRYHHPGQAFRIPTSLELAKMFGVARSTVTLELKSLAEDGIIIGKRGIGTFTNPTQEYSAEKNFPLIGIICGDGQMFFYDHYTWSLIARTGMELTSRFCHVNFVNSTFRDAEEALENIQRIKLSGIVWIAPPKASEPIIRKLVETGTPIVLAEQEFTGIPGCSYDFDRTGYLTGKRLLQSGCKSMAFLSYHDICESAEAQIQKAYLDAGETLKITNYLRFPEKPGITEFEQEIAKGHIPDVVNTHGTSSFKAMEILQKYHIRKDQCRLIVARHNIPDADFRGIVIDYPEQRLAEGLAERILAQIHGRKIRTPFLRLPCDIICVDSYAELQQLRQHIPEEENG